ncbi:Prostaglandin G/H synthase 1, partial [Lemmus lemmus]
MASMGLFSGFIHSVVVLLHAPCPLSSFWVLALSCVITPKGLPIDSCLVPIFSPWVALVLSERMDSVAPTVPAAEFWTWLRNFLRPSPSFTHFLLTHGRWFWEFVNATFIRETLMRLILTVRSNLIPSPPTYNLAHDYISWESFSNMSYYTRVLPSVPKDC